MAEETPKYLDVCVGHEGKDQKKYFTKIGAMFPHKNGKGGFNIVLDALPIGREMVAFPPKAEQAEGE